jgi:hypothetical protein
LLRAIISRVFGGFSSYGRVGREAMLKEVATEAQEAAVPFVVRKFPD